MDEGELVLDLCASEVRKIHLAQDYVENCAVKDGARLWFGMLLPHINTKSGKRVEKRMLITNGMMLPESEANKRAFEVVGALPQINRWSIPSIKKFIETPADGRGENSNEAHELLLKLENKFKQYSDLGEERSAYMLAAAWVMGTYLFTSFNSYPYISIHGAQGSGKTKFLSILQCLAFNAMQELNPSEASAFRTISALRPTLLIDEMDYMGKEQRPVIMALLRAGYKKIGGEVIRMKKVSREKSETFEAESFQLYGPKAFAAVWEAREIQDRCIPLVLIPTLKKEIRVKDVDASDLEWQELRDELYIFALRNADRIREYYVGLQNEFELDGRAWELWKPICAIIKCLSEFDYSQLGEILKRTEIKRNVERNMDREEVAVIRVLSMLVKAQPEKLFIEVELKAITELLEQESPDLLDWSELRKIRYRIGVLLGRVGIESRRVAHGSKKVYALEKAKIEELMEKFGVQKESEKEGV